MARTRTLSQLVATTTGIRQRDNDHGKELIKKVQSDALTTGLIKTHHPLEELTDEQRRGMLLGTQPDVNKPVALTVADALRQAMEYAIPALDVVATNDRTNQDANADVTLPDGTVLIANVPVSHLLWLSKYLSEWRKFITVLPVLDPTKNWTLGDSDVYRADVETRVSSTKKVVPLVLHQGTDKHAPQVQAIEDFIPTGHYESVALSGAIYPSRKRELTDRFDMVIAAVDDAIARANQTPVVDVKEGEALMSFLLA